MHRHAEARHAAEHAVHDARLLRADFLGRGVRVVQAEDARADDRPADDGGHVRLAHCKRLHRVYARAEAQQPRTRAVDEHAQLVVCLAPLRVLEHGLRAVDSVARHADPRPDLLVLAEGIPNFAVAFLTSVFNISLGNPSGTDSSAVENAT